MKAILFGLTFILGAQLAVLTYDPTPPVPFSDVLDAVVLVKAAEGTGSGVIVRSDPDGTYILTAAHVSSEGPFSVVLVTHDANGKLQDALDVPVTLVMRDEPRDLALLVLRDGFTWSTVPVASRPLVVGEAVRSVGCPLGHLPQVTEGVVSERAGTQLTVSAPIFFGNSGGPLFVWEKGHWAVAGIAHDIEGYRGQYLSHLGHFIPIEDVRDFLKENRI